MIVYDDRYQCSAKATERTRQRSVRGSVKGLIMSFYFVITSFCNYVYFFLSSHMLSERFDKCLVNECVCSFSFHLYFFKDSHVPALIASNAIRGHYKMNPIFFFTLYVYLRLPRTKTKKRKIRKK